MTVICYPIKSKKITNTSDFGNVIYYVLSYFYIKSFKLKNKNCLYFKVTINENILANNKKFLNISNHLKCNLG